jgi:hypothetical protein
VEDESGMALPPPSVGARFEVFLVPHDLREEEARHVLLDAVTWLDGVTDLVMAGITKVVIEQTDEVKEARRRLDDAGSKIRAIAGSKRATRVFSPAQFPGVEGRGCYEWPAFTPWSPRAFGTVPEPIRYFENLSSEQLLNKSASGDVLTAQEEVAVGMLPGPIQYCGNLSFDGQVLDAKPIPRGKGITRSAARVGEGVDPQEAYSAVEMNGRALPGRPEPRLEGRGELPTEIRSVSNLLNFDRTEIPYLGHAKVMRELDENVRDRRMLDASSEGEARDSAQHLAAAPVSMAHGLELPDFGAIDYSFNPSLSAAPAFSLPAVLPGLPNLADLSFDAETSSIAPSGFLSAQPRVAPAKSNRPPSIISLARASLTAPLSTCSVRQRSRTAPSRVQVAVPPPWLQPPPPCPRAPLFNSRFPRVLRPHPRLHLRPHSPHRSLRLLCRPHRLPLPLLPLPQAVLRRRLAWRQQRHRLRRRLRQHLLPPPPRRSPLSRRVGARRCLRPSEILAVTPPSPSSSWVIVLFPRWLKQAARLRFVEGICADLSGAWVHSRGFDCRQQKQVEKDGQRRPFSGEGCS